MAEKKLKKPGRPFLAKNQAKAESITIRLQAGERASLEQAASKEKITLSEWIRRALKSALDKTIVLL